MDVNGKWVGYGLGDVSLVVQKMKEFLKAKFSYASVLDDSTVYDQTMVNVVSEMQGRYNLPVTGVMNYATQIKCGFYKRQKVAVFTVSGTGTNMWDLTPPQPASIAVQLDPHLATWQPVGNYPAATFPMGPSVNDGVAELTRLFTGSDGPGPFFTSGPFILIGYSQGAMVTSHFWRDVILNGPLNNRKNDMLASVTIGNPLRAPGMANGNHFAGWPMPGQIDFNTTGGIAGPDCLHPSETPANWYDFVNTNTSDAGATELYANCPVGDDPWGAEAQAGAVETSVYNVVQQATFADVVALAADLLMPIGLVEAIVNGVQFLAAQGNADHYTYDTTPMVALLSQILHDYATAV